MSDGQCDDGIGIGGSGGGGDAGGGIRNGGDGGAGAGTILLMKTLHLGASAAACSRLTGMCPSPRLSRW